MTKKSPSSWTRRFSASTMVISVLALGLGQRTAVAAAPTALILGSTVTPCSATTGCPRSLEEEQAQAAGFATTVVDDATWGAMTAADFAQYQVIIIGDPTCDDVVDGAAGANASVWQGVVMASGGNRVIVGTDPVYHHSAHPGAVGLINNGIAFAGALSGRTGAYVDISCESSFTSDGVPFAFLDGLTTHSPGGFLTEYPPCEGAISIVAQSGPTNGLHDSDLSSWNCSVHQSFKTWPSDFTPLAIATDASSQPYCATDVDTALPVCGEPYVLVAGGGITVHSNITLDPADATNPVGGDHTVTATVVHDCQPDGTGCTPESGVVVTFTVESGPNVGKTDTATTDDGGQAQFTYSDTGGAGTDEISATFIDDVGALEKATATKTWTAMEGECGDGTIDPGEDCDDGTGNGTTTCGCDSSCHFPSPSTACDDGDACTTSDSCDGAGSCVGSAPVLCEASDACHAAGFCDSETGLCSQGAFTGCTLSSAKDSILRTNNRNTNEGANPVLSLSGGGPNRLVVGFDLAGIDLTGVTKATLVLTVSGTASGWRGLGGAVSAYPLLADFVEGNGKQLGLPHSQAVRGSGAGVTYACATDAEVSNSVPDCDPRWQGGEIGDASDSTIHTNATSGEVKWDVTTDVTAGMSGWLIGKPLGNPPGRIDYYSREGAAEAGNADLAPRLVLE